MPAGNRVPLLTFGRRGDSAPHHSNRSPVSMIFPESARRAAGVRRLLFALLALFPLLAPSAVAQNSSASALAPTAPAEAVTVADLEALVGTLTDEAERERLIRQLRALIAAQRTAPAGAERRPFGAALLDTLSDRVTELGDEIAAAAGYAVDLPEAWEWVEAQATDPEKRDRWLEILVKLTVVLAAGILAEALARRLLARPRRAVEARATDRPLLRLMLLLLRTLLDVLPVLAFAAAAYAVVPLLEPRGTVRLVVLAIIYANVLLRLVRALVRMALAPDVPNLRFLALSDATARYIFQRIGRLAALGIYGYFAVHVLYLLGISDAAYAVLLKLLGIVMTVALILLILRNRAPVAAWVRGDAGAGGGWRRLRARLADIWHVLAIAYVAAVCVILVLEVRNGFSWLLRATLLTGMVLVAARIGTIVVREALRRGVAIGADWRRAYPTLQVHADRYLPVVQTALMALVWLVAGFTILEIWGLGVFRWAGEAVLGGALRVALVLIVAVVVWELFTAALARWLRRPGVEGETAPPSPRARTLLPLLERFALIVLTAIVGLILLSEIGINIGPLLAGAGIVGLAVGFGAQSLVKDVITGLFILLEDQFAVGDVVNVGGKGGLVEAITLRTIRLRDYDGTVYVVPFSEVGVTSNLTKEFSYYVFDVGVAYREDVDEVIGVLKEIAQELIDDPQFAPLILPPFEVAGVDKLAESGVIIKCRIKTKPIQQWTVGREFNRRMKKRFDALGIEVPFPTRRLYFGVDKQGKAPPAHVAFDGEACASASGAGGHSAPERSAPSSRQ